MKRSLRQQILDRRRTLSPEAVRTMSLQAQRILLGTAEFAAARVVALYSPIRNEVQTDLTCSMALAQGKTVVFPSVSGQALVFRSVTGEDDLAPGAFGIMEPLESCVTVEPPEADLIVVPGVAFDIHGRRIGYGRGFYDRTLHALEGGGRLFGMCYELQVLEQIVAEPHDVIMDRIVTEQRVINCKQLLPREKKSCQ